MSVTFEQNTTTTATPCYAQYCSNRLPCGICKLMQVACPLNVNSWKTTWKNPYEVTCVDYSKKGEPMAVTVKGGCEWKENQLT